MLFDNAPRSCALVLDLAHQGPCPRCNFYRVERAPEVTEGHVPLLFLPHNFLLINSSLSPHILSQEGQGPPEGPPYGLLQGSLSGILKGLPQEGKHLPVT